MAMMTICYLIMNICGELYTKGSIELHLCNPTTLFLKRETKLMTSCSTKRSSILSQKSVLRNESRPSSSSSFPPDSFGSFYSFFVIVALPIKKDRKYSLD